MHRRWRRRSTRSSIASGRYRPSPRRYGCPRRPRWPMIVLRSPKGWTGPKEVDGKKVEGFWRAHQVPVADAAQDDGASQDPRGLDAQLRSRGTVRRRRAGCSRSCAALAPGGERRMGANPHANGGLAAARNSSCPTSATTRSRCHTPGADMAQTTRVLGEVSARRDEAQRRERATSASSVRTKRPRTGSTMSSRSPTASGWRRSSPTTSSVAATAG